MTLGHKRYSEKTSHPEIKAYKLKGGKEYDEKANPLIEQVRTVVSRIQA